MWSFGAGMFAAAVHGCPEKVRARVHASCVDVVVLCEVAHFGDGRQLVFGDYENLGRRQEACSSLCVSQAKGASQEEAEMDTLETNNQRQCQIDKTRSGTLDVCRRHSVIIMSQAERGVFDKRAEWASAMTFGAAGPNL